MNRVGAILAGGLLSVAIASCAGAMSSAPPPADTPFVEGRLLVRFHPGVTQERIELIVREEGATVSRRLAGGDVLLLLLPPGRSVPEAVRRFQGRPEVEYAEPDYKAKLLE
jgi:hypothetical protein